MFLAKFASFVCLSNCPKAGLFVQSYLFSCPFAIVTLSLSPFLCPQTPFRERMWEQNKKKRFYDKEKKKTHEEWKQSQTWPNKL